MIAKELVIIGAGPAGLAAAIAASDAGAKVLIIDRSPLIGGQLVKQTHKFFGSEQQYAKTRGFDIAKRLVEQVTARKDRIEIMTDTTAAALYPDRVVTIVHANKYQKIQAGAVIIAAGASEKILAFENNDLPGIYGAGAVQTLMNVYGVLPGKRILMVGSGNIGLIVSYQLLQAGVEVAAVIEAASSIGGYLVHAAKITRLGVPILTRTTIKKAEGQQAVDRVETIGLDADWQPISGTERTFDVDAVCIAVGLSPLHQLLSMAGARTAFIQELGGFVPLLSEEHETTLANVFVAGDAAGVEEASSALVEGRLAGLCAARKLGHVHSDFEREVADCHHQLAVLRSGPFGQKTLSGIAKMQEVASHAR
ncbi:MAG: FAD/NAD(P)-binding oxidoreductase [bacterium]